MLERCKQKAHKAKVETYALYLAYRDPKTPRYAKLLALAIVAYATSPIELIPDFIPVLGILDDLVIVPLGAALSIKMVPKEVMTECRERADTAMKPGASPTSRWLVAAIIIAIWCVLATLAVMVTFEIVDT